jgi:hypothetical protein
MNWENGCVSDGGDERPPGPFGLLTACELCACRPLGGVTVPSLKPSDAVDSLCVMGEGNCPCLRRLVGGPGDRRE